MVEAQFEPFEIILPHYFIPRPNVPGVSESGFRADVAST